MCEVCVDKRRVTEPRLKLTKLTCCRVDQHIFPFFHHHFYVPPKWDTQA